MKKKKRGQYCYDHPRPAVTVDVALFRRAGGQIEVLLIRRARTPFEGMWALPGGFVDQDESLEAAAARELEEETGIKGVKFKQIGAFGDPGRDPRGHTVSIAFAAVVARKVQARAADDARQAEWHPINQLPRLAFDHGRIIKAAARHVFKKKPRNR